VTLMREIHILNALLLSTGRVPRPTGDHGIGPDGAWSSAALVRLTGSLRDGAVHVEVQSDVLRRHLAGVAKPIAVLTLLLFVCAVTAQPEPQDYTGTWVFKGTDGHRVAEFTVSADRTFTARNIPIDLAGRTGNAATSPPGCASGGDSASFSGRWKLADGDSPRQSPVLDPDGWVNDHFGMGTHVHSIVRR
jgi:hypothetical protein